MKIKTVIFDFDGVIADTLPYTFKKIIEITKTLKYQDSDQKKIIEEIRLKDWRELLHKGFPGFWLKMPIVLFIISRMQIQLQKEIKKIKIFSGIKKLLIDLKKNNFQLLILSSNLKENINKFIEFNNINYFDEINAGTFSMLKKSERINLIIKQLRILKEEVIYIGDEIRDVEACRKAGIKFIGVSWGLHKPEVLKKHGADFIAEKPSEILKIINEN